MEKKRTHTCTLTTPLNVFLGLLIQEIHLGENINVGQLQCHHGGESYQDTREVLADIDEKLGVEQEDAAEPKIPLL